MRPHLKIPMTRTVYYPKEWEGLPPAEILRRLAHLTELQRIRNRATPRLRAQR